LDVAPDSHRRGKTPQPRRDFLRRVATAAGVAPAALAWFAGRLDALPRGEATDMGVLAASIALEHHAIALYEFGLERRLFPAGLRDYALEFRGDHIGHRDTQALIARERGGEPPEPLRDYGFARLVSHGDDLLREALEVEQAAQLAYLKVISQIRTRDYLLSAAFVMVDEVRHLTVWRRVLGYRLY
jgi:rubrerythrin